MTRTRAELKTAIEVGISAAGDGLTEKERIALRVVGEHARLVMVRQFGDASCGCPVTLAGLVDQTDGRARITRGQWSFAKTFDDTIGGVRGKVAIVG